MLTNNNNNNNNNNDNNINNNNSNSNSNRINQPRVYFLDLGLNVFRFQYCVLIVEKINSINFFILGHLSDKSNSAEKKAVKPTQAVFQSQSTNFATFR